MSFSPTPSLLEPAWKFIDLITAAQTTLEIVRAVREKRLAGGGGQYRSERASRKRNSFPFDADPSMLIHAVSSRFLQMAIAQIPEIAVRSL